MKPDTCKDLMRESVTAYTKYEGGGRRHAPSYNDSNRATGVSDAVDGRGKRSSGSRTPRVVHKINFRVLPLPGTVLMHEGQRYVAIGSDLHTRRDGQTVPIICWKSHCAECGRPFDGWSGLRSGTLNRRCPEHHAPGKAVTAAGRKRAAPHRRKHGKRKKP
ncbi:hypothetical protein ROE7235_03216 [Roseibaca ekhonensis]|uniref:Uncharacterized protein n=1 Tax=Roseinatronobacter ekhonensis TaxID=254356 RepID=A0A3B0N082_9RHOB|nr:hypothetical protein ROE7235_03216 [Roseibaca ekhonensis]